MLALYILLGILAFLLLLLLLPVNFYLAFDEELTVRVRYTFLTYSLFPMKTKEKASKKASHKTSKKRNQKKQEKKKAKEREKHTLPSIGEMFKEDGVSATLSYITELVKLAGTAVKKVTRILVVDKLALELRIATDDAADTAVEYGKACGIVYPAQAVLETAFRIQKRQIDVYPDFTSDKGRAVFFLKIHVLPLRVLEAAVGIIFRYLVKTIRHGAGDMSMQTAASINHAG